MPLLRLIRTLGATSAVLAVCLTCQPACASSLVVPSLLAKTWAVGYLLLGLGVLLGIFAVTITSRRKTIRKRDS